MSTISESGDFDFPLVDLPADAVACESIVRFLIGELVRTGRLRPEFSEKATLQILDRESLGSTAIGRGVAIPHARSDLVETVEGIIGRSSRPLAWSSTPKELPIKTVCLLLTPASHPGDALRAIESVSRHFWEQ